MCETEDIRWRQRFDGFGRALRFMERLVNPLRGRELSELERHGVYKAFELVHDQACGFLKAYLEYEGAGLLFGYRETLRKALQVGLVQDHATWAEMFDVREKIADTCDLDMLAAAADMVVARFEPAIVELHVRFADIAATAKARARARAALKDAGQ